MGCGNVRPLKEELKSSNRTVERLKCTVRGFKWVSKLFNRSVEALNLTVEGLKRTVQGFKWASNPFNRTVEALKRTVGGFVLLFASKQGKKGECLCFLSKAQFLYSGNCCGLAGIFFIETFSFGEYFAIQNGIYNKYPAATF